MDEQRVIGKLLGGMIGAAVGGALAYVAGARLIAGVGLGAAVGQLTTAMVLSRSHAEVACTHCGHRAADPEATFCTACNRALSGLF